MIKYIQNRTWFVNHTFKNIDAIQSLQSDASGTKFIISRADDTQTGSGEKGIRIDFSSDYIKELQASLDTIDDSVTLESIDVILKESGFAWFTIICAYHPAKFDFEFITNTINGNISKLINENSGAFDDLLSRMENSGIIVKSKQFNYGVPEILEKEGLHSKFRSYLYNVHVLFIDQDADYQEFKEKLHSQVSTVKLSGGNAFSILDSDWFWSVSSGDFNRPFLDKLLYPNFLALTESVLFSNAIFCYSCLLEMMVARKKVDSDLVRYIINVNNSKMLNIKKMRPYLNPDQITHINHHHSFFMEGRYELYNAAYKSLNIALSGLDTQVSQKANRVVQFILVLFTGLTLYSVAYDVVSLLSKDELIGEFTMIKSTILLGVTVVIGVMFLMLRKITRHL